MDWHLILCITPVLIGNGIEPLLGECVLSSDSTGDDDRLALGQVPTFADYNRECCGLLTTSSSAPCSQKIL